MRRNLFSKIKSALKGHPTRALVISTIVTTLLDLLSIALILPLLLIILEGKGSSHSTLTGKLFHLSGLDNFNHFVVLLVVAVLILVIFKNFALHKASNFKTKTLLKCYSGISASLFEHYFGKGVAFVKTEGPSALSQNINSGAYNFIFGVVSPILTIAGDLFLIMLVLGILLIVSPLVAVIELLLLLPVVVFYRFRVGERIKEAGREDNESRRDQWRITVETFRGYADIALNGKFLTMLGMFRRGTERISGNKLYLESMKSSTGRVMESVVFLIICSLIILYLFLAPTETERFRLMIAIFTASSVKLLPLVKGVVTGAATVRNSLYTVDIVDEIVNSGKIVNSGNFEKISLETFDSLEINNISFAFDNGREIISDFSMHIKRGERVAITGLSGSGKTTLLYLLAGLYYPQKGEILINGKKLDSKLFSTWSTIIGYVSQEIFLINGTIEDNIILSSQKDSGLLDDVVKKASLNTLIERLPEGLQTKVGEGGALLSGGERQRVALARAFYKNASVLLLDEPTSALDKETTESILNALTSSTNLTIIVITHNEKIIELSDKVITQNG